MITTSIKIYQCEILISDGLMTTHKQPLHMTRHKQHNALFIQQDRCLLTAKSYAKLIGPADCTCPLDACIPINIYCCVCNHIMCVLKDGICYSAYVRGMTMINASALSNLLLLAVLDPSPPTGVVLLLSLPSLVLHVLLQYYSTSKKILHWVLRNLNQIVL